MEQSWVKVAMKHQKEFEESGFKEWDDYVEEKKKTQSYAKLEELGYRYDSGLYGWLIKEDKE